MKIEELIGLAEQPTKLAAVLYAIVGLGRDLDHVFAALEAGDIEQFKRGKIALHDMYEETAKRAIEALGHPRPEGSGGVASALMRALDRQVDREERAHKRAAKAAAGGRLTV